MKKLIYIIVLLVSFLGYSQTPFPSGARYPNATLSDTLSSQTRIPILHANSGNLMNKYIPIDSISAYIDMDKMTETANSKILTAAERALIGGAIQTETDPIYSAWDKDYNDLINTPTIPPAVTINNTLTSTSTTEALSAAQGKVLKDVQDLKANLASPTFTGTPLAPTAAPGTNTTQIATTAFVTDALNDAVIGVGTGATPIPHTFTGGETTWDIGSTITNSHILMYGSGTGTLVPLQRDVDYTWLGDTFTFIGSTLPIEADEVAFYYPNVAVPEAGNVPTGGTAGQVLAKVDGTDYNTEWVDQTGGGTYTDEQAQDAVGTILVNSSEIALTYNDGTPSISGTLVAGGIALSKLDTSLQSSIGSISSKANLASPTFTGVPLAPTATVGTNTTQIATTAFVQNELGSVVAGFGTGVNTALGINLNAAGGLTSTNGSATLSSKSIPLGSNTLTGTKLQFNTSLIDDDFVFTSDYTDAAVLAKLLTVDGSGSGLDADLLRGVHWGNVNTNINTSGTISAQGLTNTLGSNAGSAVSLNLNAAAGQFKDIIFSSGGNLRWIISSNDTAESGSNLGSNLLIRGRTDAGEALLTAAFFINRNSGNVSIGNTNDTYKLDVSGTGRFTSNLTANSFIKSGGTSGQYLMADGSTTTAPPSSYTVLTGVFYQLGTSDPVLTIFENTTGATMTATRTDVGRYIITSSSPVFSNTTSWVMISQTSNEGFAIVGSWHMWQSSTTTIDIQSRNTSEAFADGVINYIPFEIRTY